MKKNREVTDTNVGDIENSIEEDMKNAEHFINSIKTDKDYKDENGWHGYYNTEIVELARILDHILSDYKRVLKENEKIRNGRNRLFEYATAQQTTPEMLNKILREDYISIQKVKDKQKEKEWALESYDCDEADYKQSQAIGAWQVLQELIEERREK